MKPGDNNLNLPSDPVDGVLQWYKDAEEFGVLEPSAMTLASVGQDGRPSARIILYKGLSQDSQGRRCLRFFTNYSSRKSQELSQHSGAALVFFWNQMKRQIRIEGTVEKTSYEESNAYFQTRPRASQIGAWASPQSQTLTDRAELERLVKDIETRFAGQSVPCPENWGGWRLRPERVEFWQGIDYRLHDRILYAVENGTWISQRLAP